MNLKKAAMFGLDARIALAIFGALSVISGAALYKSIKHTKAVKMVMQIEELKKAMDQYILDTGTYLPLQSDVWSEVGNLYKNYAGVEGWKGPYYGRGSLQAMEISIDLTGTKTIDDRWYAGTASPVEKDKPPSFNNLYNYPACVAAPGCDIVLRQAAALDGDDSKVLKDMFYTLDDYVDSNDGPGRGTIRARIDGTFFAIAIYLAPEWRRLRGLV